MDCISFGRRISCTSGPELDGYGQNAMVSRSCTDAPADTIYAATPFADDGYQQSFRGRLIDSSDTMVLERRSVRWVGEQTDSGLRSDGGEVSR